jgi:hypothetical protein
MGSKKGCAGGWRVDDILGDISISFFKQLSRILSIGIPEHHIQTNLFSVLFAVIEIKGPIVFNNIIKSSIQQHNPDFIMKVSNHVLACNP